MYLKPSKKNLPAFGQNFRMPTETNQILRSDRLALCPAEAGVLADSRTRVNYPRTEARQPGARESILTRKNKWGKSIQRMFHSSFLALSYRILALRHF